MSSDPYQLQRFRIAQDPVYDTALAELRRGRKESHWMWFVFPQLQGLGSSAMARRYALCSGDEALAYDAHPLLGARLRECTQALLQLPATAIGDIFAYPDDLKFHSCMTLFAAIAPQEPLYREALARFFQGTADPVTAAALNRRP